MKKINLKAEIESICWKVGVNPKEVQLIEIRPMDVSVTLRETPTESGYDKVTRTTPYAYEGDEDGDTEAV